MKFIAFHLLFSVISFHSIQSIFVNFNRQFFFSLTFSLSGVLIRLEKKENITRIRQRATIKKICLMFSLFFFTMCSSLWPCNFFMMLIKMLRQNWMLFVRDSILVLLTIHRYVMLAYKIAFINELKCNLLDVIYDFKLIFFSSFHSSSYFQNVQMLFIRHSSLALNISNNIHIAKICSGSSLFFFPLISCFDSKLELHRCVVSLLSFARILCIYCVFFFSLSLSLSQCRCMRFFLTLHKT